MSNYSAAITHPPPWRSLPISFVRSPRVASLLICLFKKKKVNGIFPQNWVEYLFDRSTHTLSWELPRLSHSHPLWCRLVHHIDFILDSSMRKIFSLSQENVSFFGWNESKKREVWVSLWRLWFSMISSNSFTLYPKIHRHPLPLTPLQSTNARYVSEKKERVEWRRQ